ncbi:hypothetical protein [Candidatus Pantoea formicae]|uniref:hypothetical protein n=1 Tax=Candidatus Pantoea formicae TaxID=2608355 RepID=UPI003EDA0062
MTLNAFYSPSLKSVIMFVYVQNGKYYGYWSREDIDAETLMGLYSRYPDIELIDADLAEKRRDAQYIRPWEEITQERYDDMFNTLYPEDWHGGESSGFESFKFKEGYTNNISYIFARVKNRYFECRDYKTKTHETIREELKKYF